MPFVIKLSVAWSTQISESDLMDKSVAYSSIVLGFAVLISLIARMIFPQIQPVLDGMRIIFYLILAVTVIAVLRNVFGLITYGVFGPAIISLGLTIIDNVYIGFGVVLAIIGIGLIVRGLLEPLELQMTHRMAIMVITVSSIMGIFKYVGFALGKDPLTFATFLPILISAWVIERFMRDRQESGLKTSIQRFAYTLIAVIASFLLLSEKSIIQYFIYTPELWILPVAINLLLGSTIRIRLSEYFRFGKLVKTSTDGNASFSQVLTANVRNRDFIDKYNPRNLYTKITKLGVKKSLQNAGIPVPETLATLNTYKDIKNLRDTLESLPPEKGFVIKPNNSFGGRGIVVIKRRNGDTFEKVNGEQVTLEEIKHELEVTMDGEYTGRWIPDKALIEELITSDPKLGKLSYAGLPDVRVIVFRGIPVMAMARLPTKKSNGRANLHQGAIGAGINLVDGEITNAVVAYQKEPVKRHPDTGVELIGEQIPFWDEILKIAANSQKTTHLGYAGVDIVIDKDKGPLVMEVNKRPGMEIQNANNKPLLERLRLVEAFLENRDVSAEEGIKTMLLFESKNWKSHSNEGAFSMEDF